MNYRTSTGAWRPIDPAIAPSRHGGYAYANETDSFRSYFGTEEGRLVRFEAAGASVVIGVAGARWIVQPRPVPTPRDPGYDSFIERAFHPAPDSDCCRPFNVDTPEPSDAVRHTELQWAKSYFMRKGRARTTGQWTGTTP